MSGGFTTPGRGAGARRRSSPPLAALLLVLSAAGCGERDVVAADPPERAYDGPLYVAPEDAAHPRAGAAGDVVECRTWGAGGFSTADVYAEGATAGSPERALSVARGEGGFSGAYDGLRVAGRAEDRVLYVLEVGGDWKQAVIVRDGPATKGAGGPGWYVESWARCDWSEYPRAFTDRMGLQIWTDRSGRPAPTTRIESWTGSAHCDWQSMTFLYLGDDVYVRDPQPDLGEFFSEPYQPHVEVPGDAVDTGFQRDGDSLWLSRDRRRAYVGTPEDAELWPRTAQPLGCA